MKKNGLRTSAMIAAFVYGVFGSDIRASSFDSNPIVTSAQYTVPVSQELLTAASFHLVDPKLEIIDGKRIIQFTSPEDLVGNTTNQVTLRELPASGGEPFIPFDGDRAHARCLFSAETKMLCLVRSKASPDLVRVEEVLNRKYVSEPEHLSNALSVARIFHNEPSGVARIEFEK